MVDLNSNPGANAIARAYYLLTDLSAELAGQTSELAQYSPLAINGADLVESARVKLESKLKSIITLNPSDAIVAELELLS